MKIFNIFKKSDEPVSPTMVKVKMPDGSIEEYPINFAITDGKHCVSAPNEKTYHTHFDCPNLPKGNVLIGWKNYDANANGLSKCYKCEQFEELDNES